MKKLRVVRVLVQIETVWDDGEELTPGPGIEPVSLPHSELAAFAENLPAKLAEIADQLNVPATLGEQRSDGGRV